MGGNSDADYWLLVLVGIFIVGGIMLWAVLRSKPREQEMHDPTTEAATKRLYEEEQRTHENDKSSGL
jgi:hypothetical protein